MVKTAFWCLEPFRHGSRAW